MSARRRTLTPSSGEVSGGSVFDLRCNKTLHLLVTHLLKYNQRDYNCSIPVLDWVVLWKWILIMISEENLKRRCNSHQQEHIFFRGV